MEARTEGGMGEREGYVGIKREEVDGGNAGGTERKTEREGERMREGVGGGEKMLTVALQTTCNALYLTYS